MENKYTRCIICGDQFPSTKVALPDKSGKPSKWYQKEVCDFCTAKEHPTRQATMRRYPDAPVDGYIALAVAIERGVLSNYRHAYQEALKAEQRMDSVCSDEEVAFLRMHHGLMESPYHHALTFSNIKELLDYARRDVQADFPAFKDKDGLALIEERYSWFVRMNERAKGIETTKEETNGK